MYTRPVWVPPLLHSTPRLLPKATPPSHSTTLPPQATPPGTGGGKKIRGNGIQPLFAQPTPRGEGGMQNFPYTYDQNFYQTKPLQGKNSAR